MPQDARYQEITKELYSKNLDLLNANKTLELIQKLYEIMIVSFSLESVSQHFIDLITESLGFSDGLVAVHSEKNSHLVISGMTQSRLNAAALEQIAIPTVRVRYETSYETNALIRAYTSGKGYVVHSLADIWTPYLKPEDVSQTPILMAEQTILVYPIIFGEKVLGSFYLIMGKGSKDITAFEKKALDRITTVFGIAIDRIRINQELRASELRELAKTKELLKLKDEFVFIATHDLKTPVTAIKGFLELLEGDLTHSAMTPRMQENLSAIKESSHRLTQLTTDLLEVARSDSGTINVSLSEVDLYEAIQNSIQQVQVHAQKRAVTIEHSIAPHTMVRADKTRLSEVLENLLTNAVKYNREGGSVTIAAEVGNTVSVSIKDTGIGIPQEQHAKVFEKFFRAHQRGTEDIPGTGLGLFVVRMLVEKMGGTIRFTSTEGEGTTFVFTLQSAG